MPISHHALAKKSYGKFKKSPLSSETCLFGQLDIEQLNVINLALRQGGFWGIALGLSSVLGSG